jgi:hypothetical protein
MPFGLMAGNFLASVTIAALTHDLVRKRSIAPLVWDTDPEKRVAVLTEDARNRIGAVAEKVERQIVLDRREEESKTKSIKQEADEPSQTSRLLGRSLT